MVGVVFFEEIQQKGQDWYLHSAHGTSTSLREGVLLSNAGEKSWQGWQTSKFGTTLGAFPITHTVQNFEKRKLSWPRLATILSMFPKLCSPCNLFYPGTEVITPHLLWVHQLHPGHPLPYIAPHPKVQDQRAPHSVTAAPTLRSRTFGL